MNGPDLKALEGMAVDLAATPPEPAISDLTFVDLIGLAFHRAGAYLETSEHPGAKREYALAKTAIEDAVMRFNRGRSIDLDVFHVADTEDQGYLDALSAMQAEQAKATTEGA